jgi:hypothetical protein
MLDGDLEYLWPEGSRCPLCNGASRSTGMVRIAVGASTGEVVENRECLACGERWQVDDDGHAVGAAAGSGA